MFISIDLVPPYGVAWTWFCEIASHNWILCQVILDEFSKVLCFKIRFKFWLFAKDKNIPILNLYTLTLALSLPSSSVGARWHVPHYYYTVESKIKSYFFPSISALARLCIRFTNKTEIILKLKKYWKYIWLE